MYAFFLIVKIVDAIIEITWIQDIKNTTPTNWFRI